MKTTLLLTAFLIFFNILRSNAQTPLFRRVLVSDVGFNNNIGEANTSRNLAITDNGIIYAVYTGTQGIRVAKSTNRGQSFLPSVQVTATQLTEPEIAVNSDGIVFVCWVESSSLFFSRSIDQGISFSPPRNLGFVISGGFGSVAHMTTFGKNVYIRDRPGRNFFRNNDNGNGVFIQSTLPRTDVFSDVRTDVNGVVHLPSDNPTLYLFNSKDNGVNTQEVNLIPRGRVFFSSYALSDSPAGTFIFVAGNGSSGYKIEAETGIATLIEFKPNNATSQGRTLFADNFGALVDGYRTITGDIKMSISYDQGITFPLDITIDNAVSHNIERNPEKDDLDIIYEIGGQIFMDVFDGLLRSVKIPEPSITFNLCQGESSVVPFTLTGAFIDNSEFFLFLSDENGSFENKTQVGFIDSKVDGAIGITIPNTIPSSNKYRLQIQSPENFLQSNIVPIEIGTVLDLGEVEDSILCDSGDGSAIFDLTSQEAIIRKGQPELLISYFLTKDDAQTKTSPITTPRNFKGLGDTEIWVRIDSPPTIPCPGFSFISFEAKVESLPDISTTVSPLEKCDDLSDTNGFGTFDLTTKINEILKGKDEVDFDISFYSDSSRLSLIPLPETYINTVQNSQPIYVTVAKKEEPRCSLNTQFNIIVNPLPVLKTSKTSLKECDNDGDGVSEFDLSSINSLISDNSASENFTYYTSMSLAEIGLAGTEITSISNYKNPTPTGSKIFTRIETAKNCYRTVEVELNLESPVTTGIASDIIVCDSGDGTAFFDLTSQESNIQNSQTSASVTYFLTENNARLNINLISKPFNFKSSSTTIWARLVDPTITKCSSFALTSFDLVVKPLPKISTTIENLKTCDDIAFGSDIDGFTTFNLTSKINEILTGKNPSDFTIDFFSDNARSIKITNPTNYRNTTKDKQTIYVTVTEKTALMCAAQTQFDIEVTPLPILKTATVILKQCDDDIDGISFFNLNEANQLLSTNFLNETFTFYTSSSLAESGIDGTEILISNAYQNPTVTGSKVYARIENENTCFRTATVELQVGVSNIPQSFFDALNVNECDDGNTEDEYTDGITRFNFTDLKNSVNGFFSPLAVTTTFYESQENALSEKDPININNYRNSIPDKQRIYVRVDGTINNDCQGFGDFEITVNSIPQKNEITDLIACGITTSEFDLTLKNDEIKGSQTADINIFFYETIANRNSDIRILNPSKYISPEKTIYVRSAFDILNGCSNSDIQFNLKIDNLILKTPSSIKKCSITTETQYDLTIREDEIANRDDNGNDNLTFQYFKNTTELDANNPIIAPENYTNTILNNTVIVKVTNQNNCEATTTLSLQTTLFADINTTLPPLEVCDTANDGFEIFDLTQIEPEIIRGTGQLISNFSFKYYETESEALNDSQSQILNTSNYQNIIPNTQKIFVRVTQFNGECSKVISFTIKTNPKPIITLPNQYVFCRDSDNSLLFSDNETAIPQLPIDTNLSEIDYSFKWFKGFITDNSSILINTNPEYLPSEPGTYTVEVTNNITGCSAVATTEVIPSNIAKKITLTERSNLFSENKIIEINVEGTGNYEYSSDNETWQLSNQFSRLRRGESTFYVRDIYNCNVLSEKIEIVNYPRFFTPNNDGYNDAWTIEGSEEIFISSIQIFNRYGKLLKQVLPNSSGWDGTYIGTPMPSDQYWFVVEYNEKQSSTKKQFKASFILKR